jgi:ABC-2 type transport system permease protein
MTAAPLNLSSRPTSRVTPLWALYLLSLRQHLHGKRWMIIGVLFLLPAALAILLRNTAPNIPSKALEFMMVFMFIPQALLPLSALVYASGIIQDELEEQTITYPLMRPISKWAFYLVKLAATLTTVLILTAVFTATTFAAVYVGSDTPANEVISRCLTTIGLHCLAAGAYCCLFGLISMFTRRSLIAGIIYAVLVEGVLANLPFSVRLLTVIYYSRLIAYHSLSFVVQLPGGGSNDIAADAWQLDVFRDPDLLEHPSLHACLLTLLIGAVVCAGVAAFLCARREFYVKTPEKT